MLTTPMKTQADRDKCSEIRNQRVCSNTLYIIPCFKTQPFFVFGSFKPCMTRKAMRQSNLGPLRHCAHTFSEEIGNSTGYNHLSPQSSCIKTAQSSLSWRYREEWDISSESVEASSHPYHGIPSLYTFDSIPSCLLSNMMHHAIHEYAHTSLNKQTISDLSTPLSSSSDRNFSSSRAVLRLFHASLFILFLLIFTLISFRVLFNDIYHFTCLLHN